MKNALAQSQLIKRPTQSIQDGKEDPRAVVAAASPYNTSVLVEFETVSSLVDQLNERIEKMQDRISGILVQEGQVTTKKDEVFTADATKSALGNGLKSIAYRLSGSIGKLDRIIDRVDL